YFRADGSRQRRAIAFQGEVLTAAGLSISEVFIVDLPEDPTHPGDGPLQGTATTRPRPPGGTVQRRLTRTAERKFPGIQGPRDRPNNTADAPINRRGCAPSGGVRLLAGRKIDRVCATRRR